MVDDKTKKREDAKRISLTQRYEVDYIKKICKRLIRLCIYHKGCKILFVNKKFETIHFSITSLERIAKAFLKLSARKRR